MKKLIYLALVFIIVQPLMAGPPRPPRPPRDNEQSDTWSAGNSSGGSEIRLPRLPRLPDIQIQIPPPPPQVYYKAPLGYYDYRPEPQVVYVEKKTEVIYIQQVQTQVVYVTVSKDNSTNIRQSISVRLSDYYLTEVIAIDRGELKNKDIISQLVKEEFRKIKVDDIVDKTPLFLETVERLKYKGIQILIDQYYIDDMRKSRNN